MVFEERSLQAGFILPEFLSEQFKPEKAGWFTLVSLFFSG
jgi:hypothetical protein